MRLRGALAKGGLSCQLGRQGGRRGLLRSEAGPSWSALRGHPESGISAFSTSASPAESGYVDS